MTPVDANKYGGDDSLTETSDISSYVSTVEPQIMSGSGITTSDGVKITYSEEDQESTTESPSEEIVLEISESSSIDRTAKKAQMDYNSNSIDSYSETLSASIMTESRIGEKEKQYKKDKTGKKEFYITTRERTDESTSSVVSVSSDKSGRGSRSSGINTDEQEVSQERVLTRTLVL
eukprot:CAMPEP_0168518910 /NCGR_PEP_ID=MMETSP0405-20121227/7001_1 /TAXON_ID=498012 /ORGANISM="Trichosphaerium sp, Strain Am-I-7 wt" /LENGTH=175 /DNA_ID=CAMNT_0008539347 /DNA_START=219 /DNA_END=746 /DNA_ORIENTATION=+